MGYTFMLSVFFWPKQVTWQSLWVFVSQEVIWVKKTQKRETLILDYALRAWSPGPIVWAECHGRSF